MATRRPPGDTLTATGVSSMIMSRRLAGKALCSPLDWCLVYHAETGRQGDGETGRWGDGGLLSRKREDAALAPALVAARRSAVSYERA